MNRCATYFGLQTQSYVIADDCCTVAREDGDWNMLVSQTMTRKKGGRRCDTSGRKGWDEESKSRDTKEILVSKKGVIIAFKQ